MLLQAQHETATSKATTQMVVFPRENGFFGIMSSNPLLRKNYPQARPCAQKITAPLKCCRKPDHHEA
jgi:hypothetical protein